MVTGWSSVNREYPDLFFSRWPYVQWQAVFFLEPLDRAKRLVPVDLVPTIHVEALAGFKVGREDKDGGVIPATLDQRVKRKDFITIKWDEHLIASIRQRMLDPCL